MKFMVFEDDNSYEEEYQLEDFDININEYLKPQPVKL